MITPPEYVSLRIAVGGYLDGRVSTDELDAALQRVLERELVLQQLFRESVVTTVSWDCLDLGELRHQLKQHASLYQGRSRA